VKVPKIHLSRKLVLIVGGVLVLCGGTGGAAVYIGADTLLGPSYAELNGLECTEVQVVEIRKKDRYWIRKYVTTDKPGDGLTRIKTALRVAKTVQEAKKADLVQVVVLDTNGPKDRADMRGRAVGADVIYVPDPARVPEATPARVLTARYADGLAATNGQYFGERINMTEGDVQALLAKLNDSTDCVKPEVIVPEGEGHGDGKAAGHGKKTEGHGETGGHGEAPAEGHGEAPAEGHGEAPAAGHGEAPAGEHGAETPTAEHGGGESKGWMASLMGMVGLGGDEAPAEAHGAAEAGHGEAPASGHGEPAAAEHGNGDDHAAPAEDSAALPEGEHSAESVAHGDAGAEHGAASEATDADGHDATGHGSTEGHDAPVTEEQAQEAVTHETEAPAVETSDAPKDGHDTAAPEAPAHDAAAAEAPAEGGGWFSSLKSMVGLGGEEASTGGEGEAAPAESPAAPAASGEDHGAAWLEKMRSQPIEPAAEGSSAPAPNGEGAAADHPPADGEAAAGHTADAGHGEAPAAPSEDEAVLPPKKVIPAEEAKAGH
jgi:hypothetical protein